MGSCYSYIKRQKGGIFKTSPNQAAAQIVETVIRERDKFSYCVEYLNKLHPDRKLQLENNRKEKREKRKMLQEKKIKVLLKMTSIDIVIKSKSII